MSLILLNLIALGLILTGSCVLVLLLGAAGVFFTVRNRGRKLAAAQNKENP